MDAIMDLAARAVSLITLTQDTFLRTAVAHENGQQEKVPVVFGPQFRERFKVEIQSIKAYEEACKQRFNPDTSEEKKGLDFESKMFDLIWYSGKHVPDDDLETKEKAEQFLVALCEGLSDWITDNRSALLAQIETNHKEVAAAIKRNNLIAPPYIWFDAISEILYCNKEERVALAKALEYVPIHLILALGGGGYTASEQRVLQWWQTKRSYEAMLLTDEEKSLHQHFKTQLYKKSNVNKKIDDLDHEAEQKLVQAYYTERVAFLLAHYDQLTKGLLHQNAPLSFEYVFAEELNEIETARIRRQKEPSLVSFLPDQGPKSNQQESNAASYSCDPFVKAKKMGLCALSLSGGGIRSATFNLGILQGLARQGFLNKIDYLSTVSGGGYIGSWLATWIKREGSVAKVADRLNPDLSADPMSEEVRPIRWLRMFSNHFAPNKSIMSVDSWTIGITWLRNTLLNQVVIFFILMAVLLLLRVFFEVWSLEKIWSNGIASISVYVISCLLLIAIAFLAGVGMQWYNKGSSTQLPLGGGGRHITDYLQYLTFAGAFLVSAILYFNQATGFYGKLNATWPAGIVVAGILLMIAVYGRYDKCITSFGISQARAKLIIVYTAILAAAAGTLALMGAWKLLELMRPSEAAAVGVPNIFLKHALGFTLGLPLVLLVFGVTVVARMALLGKYFPDERREWWGRMGAVINRFGMVWILIAASCFLLRDTIGYFLTEWKAPVTIGGWMVLVGGAVKAAFSAKTSGKEEGAGWQGKGLQLLSMAGPYLFILGLLVFLPALIEPLLKKTPFIRDLASTLTKTVVLAAILFLLGLLLSTRLGVNEFSMHHFYRNRLVRSYLGATRRKAAREKTANPFTHFDKLDDAKLAKFRQDQGYFGPYPVLNTALNASQTTDTSRQDRKAESFVFTPLYCGFDFSKVRSSVNTLNKTYDYGFRPTQGFAYASDNGPAIGTAMAISGAAVNPNQGYHSSTGTAFLLTVFNVQMGWWIGNPRKSKWTKSDPDFGLGYLVHNLTGSSSTKSEFVNLSDGGHFDNMGLYEMVRRRCALIILGDAEQDENFTCEGLANAIRRCRIDFGAEINIDINAIVKREGGLSKQHFVIGDITYSGEEEPSGKLLYIKSSVTGDEPVDIAEYALKNKTFPHQSTADQFFDEEQFESYRKLGMHIVEEAFRNEKVVDVLKGQKQELTPGKLVLDGIDEPLRFFDTMRSFFRNG